jgi:hypothetical protein
MQPRKVNRGMFILLGKWNYLLFMYLPFVSKRMSNARSCFVFSWQQLGVNKLATALVSADKN